MCGSATFAIEVSSTYHPGQANIQSELFYDDRTNVEAYPKWQAWMREKQPRLLVIRGKYDLSFDLSQPQAYAGTCPTLKFTFSTPVISPWNQLQMRSPHWSETLSVLHVEGCWRGTLAEAARRTPATHH